MLRCLSILFPISAFVSNVGYSIWKLNVCCFITGRLLNRFWKRRRRRCCHFKSFFLECEECTSSAESGFFEKGLWCDATTFPFAWLPFANILSFSLSLSLVSFLCEYFSLSYPFSTLHSFMSFRISLSFSCCRYLLFCFLSFSTCLSIPLFHFYSSHSHWNQSVAISLSHYDFCVDSILQTSSSSFPECLPRFLSYFFSILSFTFYRFLVSLSPCQVSFFLPFCLMIPKTSFLAPGPFSLLLSLSLSLIVFSFLLSPFSPTPLRFLFHYFLHLVHLSRCLHPHFRHRKDLASKVKKAFFQFRQQVKIKQIQKLLLRAGMQIPQEIVLVLNFVASLKKPLPVKTWNKISKILFLKKCLLRHFCSLSAW